jgi:GT2 family glycosyltransferase
VTQPSSSHAIVVNYSSWRLASACVTALLESGINGAVIVENASPGDDYDELAAQFSGDDRVAVVAAQVNAGFGGGVALGLQHLQDLPDTAAVWVVNPDIIPDADCLAQLLSELALGQHDIVSPVITTGRTGDDTYWYAGGHLDTVRGRTVHWGTGLSRHALLTPGAAYPVSFMTGAAPMAFMRTWRTLGGFREDLFMYWEDADLSYRALQHGLRMAVVPSAEVWHLVGGSTEAGGGSSLYHYYMQRNRAVITASWGQRLSLLRGPAGLETAKMIYRAKRDDRGGASKVLASVKGLRAGFIERRASVATGPRPKMPDEPTHIDVVQRAGENRDWAVRHLNGEVPDLWPYGLNHLATYGAFVHQVDAASVAQEVLTARTHRPTRSMHGQQQPKVTLAWDEGTAMRALARRPGGRIFAGVIWATDELQRTGYAPRLAALRRGLRSTDGVWCLSRGQLGPLRSWLGEDIAVEWIPFGIDVDFFRPSQVQPEDYILALGNDRDRDLATLISALSLVHRARPDVRIAVQTASSVTLPAFIHRLPRMAHDELAREYSKASLVVTATKDNLHLSGMTVALEAGASARPVVMSRTPGVDDYVEHGVTGLLTPVGNGGLLAEACLTVVNSSDLARRLGDAALVKVRAQHSSAQMADRLFKFVSSAH